MRPCRSETTPPYIAAVVEQTSVNTETDTAYIATSISTRDARRTPDSTAPCQIDELRNDSSGQRRCDRCLRTVTKELIATYTDTELRLTDFDISGDI